LVARFDRVGRFSKLEIGRWAKCYLSESTQVVSDGLNCFPAVTEVGAVHFPECWDIEIVPSGAVGHPEDGYGFTSAMQRLLH